MQGFVDGNIQIISIHATTQVATCAETDGMKVYIISIHATTQVATGAILHNGDTFENFNPRHHAGGDPFTITAFASSFNFNPRHHAGGDVAEKR